MAATLRLIILGSLGNIQQEIHMKWKQAILLMTLVCALGVPAFGAAISPTGSGSCAEGETGCGLIMSVTPPTAGNLWVGPGGFARSWFVFEIPAGGTMTAATLYLSEVWDRIDDPTRTYTLYQPTSHSYDGLAGGPALGSTSVTDVSRHDSSFWYDIPLNSAGLDLLNASRGSQVFLGGAVDVYDHNVLVEVITGGWGYCNAGGTLCPGPPYLDVTMSSTNPTPEPGTWILVVGGICLLPVIRRRGQRTNGSRT
jgi:hypothetical protein